MNLMLLIKTHLTNQPSCIFALRMYTQIQNLLSFMALNDTFGGN
jgi:hypothetical protein